MFGTRIPLLIACTGQLKSETDKLIGSAVGFNHYLIKPYDPQEILRLLEPLARP